MASFFISKQSEMGNVKRRKRNGIKKRISKLLNQKVILSAMGTVLITGAIIFSIGFSKNEVVAKVGKETISKDELYTILVEQYGTDALESLI